MGNLKLAIWIIALIGITYLILFAVAGIGSTEATVGQFAKDTLHGTLVENPAASVESAGNSLASWAHGAITLLTMCLAFIGLIYIGVKAENSRY